MATYEFTCNECNKTSETFRLMSKRNDPYECPSCKSFNTERNQLNRGAFRLSWRAR